MTLDPMIMDSASSGFMPAMFLMAGTMSLKAQSKAPYIMFRFP